jgi:hypothetical protein
MQSLPQTHPAMGTLDGQGASDCDQPFAFGRRPRSKNGQLIAEAPIDQLLAGSTSAITYALELGIGALSVR